MRKLFALIIVFGLVSLVAMPVWAQNEETETANPIEENLQETTTDTGSDSGLPVPGPTSDESLGDIELDPNGNAILSPQVIGDLESALQPEKSEEELRRESWIRIGIDVAIGVGAALIFLAIWWLVKLRKKEEGRLKMEDGKQKRQSRS